MVGGGSSQAVGDDSVIASPPLAESNLALKKYSTPDCFRTVVSRNDVIVVDYLVVACFGFRAWGLGFNYNDVVLPLGGATREVRTEMSAAALLPNQRRLGCQPSGKEQVA